MKLAEMTYMGFTNLWRTRLRSILTVLGVVIGIGALTSMVSFGTGMQKNITDAFEKNDLFTSMLITPGQLNMEEMMEGNISGIANMLDEKPKPLTDSTLRAIQGIEGVRIAFPDESFAGRLKFRDRETNKTIQPFPAEVSMFHPYNDLLAGEFYPHDSSNSAVIRWEALRDLGIIADYEGLDYKISKEDSLKGVKIVSADEIIGQEINLITAALNIPANPLGLILGRKIQPFEEQSSTFRISGILRPREEFSFERSRGGLFIPSITARAIPRVNFSSVWDILGGESGEDTYATIYVRVTRMEEMSRVRDEIESMGVGVFALADQLQEIKRVFLVMDSMLGAIGTVALIIAALGIINTMLMSILERTREIGIMKAVGGSENEIRYIFFVEAACIGLVGGIFGLALGWFVTRIANYVMNTGIIPELQTKVEMFYFPLWLIFGAIAFSIVVSLTAGLYPAARAARIEPVTALRHD